MTQPRNIRNANPCNVMHVAGVTWIHQRAQQTDLPYLQFEGPEWGFRAAARILLTYQQRGLRTLRQIIWRWAPPPENNAQAYVSDVSTRMKIDPDANLTLPLQLPLLLRSMARHEGGCPWDDTVIQQGIDLERHV